MLLSKKNFASSYFLALNNFTPSVKKFSFAKKAITSFFLFSLNSSGLEPRTDKSKYSTLRGLVINGKYDKRIKPINSKQITNTFIKLGADIKSIELQMGHEFPKLSRDLINEWMASK